VIASQAMTRRKRDFIEGSPFWGGFA